jgi:hypothetical protein
MTQALLTDGQDILVGTMDQPPPPPPETDPNQVYDERHMGIPRPRSIDAAVPAETLFSDSFPGDPSRWGVGPEEAISERYV